MKRNRGFSIIERMLGRSADQQHGEAAQQRAEGAGLAPDSPAALPLASLTGSALEQAYRGLLLQNQILAEDNERLQQRLSEHDRRTPEASEGSRLIRAQRDALAERSRRLRELEYESKRQQRVLQKQADEHRRLLIALAQRAREIEQLQRQATVERAQHAETHARLREKANELAMLRDRYYQLEARSQSHLPGPSAANGEF